MTLDRISRVVYGLFGVLYVLVGAGSMLLPTGWLPQAWAHRILLGESLSPFAAHLVQEFGTVLLALGFVFLWHARREEQSPTFHWAMTAYFALDGLIHWVGPHGLIGSWRRGVANSLPFAVMLLLGLLRSRAALRGLSRTWP